MRLHGSLPHVVINLNIYYNINNSCLKKGCQVLYINDLINKKKKELQMTNNDLATAIIRRFSDFSLTQTAIQRLVDGYSPKPQIQTVVALADVLGLSPDEIFQAVRLSMVKQEGGADEQSI
jgi:DNA-binding XRE family transcriptional regulator